MYYQDIYYSTNIMYEIDNAILNGKIEDLYHIKDVYGGYLSNEMIKNIRLWINILTEKKNK